MFAKLILLISAIIIYTANGSVLLWTRERLEVKPLEEFTDKTLDHLVKTLGYPEVILYKSTSALLPEFEKLVEGYHTAFTTNADINTENATEISTLEDLDLVKTKQRVDLSKGNRILSLVVVPQVRVKREVTSTTESIPVLAKGPVLYRGKSTTNIYSLLYSSQPLTLKYLNSTIELGEGILVTIGKQNKNTSSRLDATIPVGEEKIILQFLFTWQNTYWSLATVRVKSTMSNFSTNLTISNPFSVPARFSYHCNEATVFSDAEKTTELFIYDVQAQPDSKDGTFGDVYDCVDFTTVPIWSGLFVTGLLGVGLIIALIAISEIKTMDKFDNQKTKQLVITVAE